MARKLPLVVLVLLLGVAVGAPFLFGGKAEQVHREFAGKLAASGSASLRESDFSKGWFKSSARDVVEVCSTSGGCHELVVNSVLHHGPIAITGIIDGVAPLRPVQAVMISIVSFEQLSTEAKLKPGLPELKATTLAEMDGAARTTLEMPASTHSIEGKQGAMTLALGGMTGEFSGEAGSDRLSGQLSFPSFKLQDQAGFSVVLSALTAEVDGSGSDAGFVGTLNEKIGEIRMASRADDPQPVVLKDISFRLKGSRSSDGLAQTQFSGGIQAISAIGRDYGPATLEGEMLRINRAAITRTQRELDQLEAQKKPPQEMLPAMMGIYQKAIPEVLGSRPEMNLKTLTIKTPEGDVLSSFKLVGVPPQGELDLAAWLNLFQAELSLQVPAVTLWNVLDAQLQQEAQKAAALSGQPPALPSQDQIGAKVTELVNSNVFVPKLDANAYTLQVAFLEGRLLVNGQEHEGFAKLSSLLGTQSPAPVVQEPAPTP